MARTPEELEQDDSRQRVRDQVRMIRDAHDGDVVWDLPDAADHRYIFVPGRVLVALELGEAVRDFARADSEAFGADVSEPQDLGLGLSRLDFGELRSAPPPDEDFAPTLRFLRALRLLDIEFGTGAVTPDHYVHVAIGGGRPCPIREPQEVGTERWPTTLPEDDTSGTGVLVTVVDTGGPPVDGDARALAAVETVGEPMQQYAGHGTFVAAVVRGRAPGATIEHSKLLDKGGAAAESELFQGLIALLEDAPGKHIINLSAGGHTRQSLPMKSFEHLWEGRLKDADDTLLVAAAGNDGSDDPTYPAAFDWAVGVGSLDRDNSVSSFSNYGRSAHVFALGRNHINDFPTGTYVCRETPDIGDERHFVNGLARWSGTSFAAPVVTGLIAARAGSDGDSVLGARKSILADAAEDSDTSRGAYRVIAKETYLP